VDWRSSDCFGVGRRCACVSTIVAETWIALILISAELLVYAFQTRSSGGFIWKLLSGLYIATGVMLFVYLNGRPHADPVAW